MWGKTSLPASDELEVSIIGPGFGEAILVHLGNGAWAAIDSCVDEDGKCVSLAYLKALGANPDQLRFVIATHWHEDHIRGMPQLIEWSSNPQFWCPTVFAADDFLDFASAHAEDDISPLGAATSELGAVFEILLDRKIAPRLRIKILLFFQSKLCRSLRFHPCRRELRNS